MALCRSQRSCLCEGTGWVCEEHPHLPFEHDDCTSKSGRCAGPGIPCRCNPRAEYQWQAVHCGGNDRDYVFDPETDPPTAEFGGKWNTDD